MNKIVVLYWEPGSCGDFVQNVMLAGSGEYQGIVKSFRYDPSGRVVPVDIISFVKQHVNCSDNLWYEIDWLEHSLNKLVDYVETNNIQKFLIPTHRKEQVLQIKNQLPDSLSVGITYPKNMFPLVLKNWCKKVSAEDNNLKTIYNKPLHKNLAQNGVFGEYILGQQLKFGSKMPFEVSGSFDLNISLESLFAKDLTAIKSLFADSTHVDHMFNGWFNKQSQLHKYQQNLPDILKTSLGFNRLATEHTNQDIELDIFDNILINHHAGSKKQLPNFQTLSQAQNFFKELSMA